MSQTGESDNDLQIWLVKSYSDFLDETRKNLVWSEVIEIYSISVRKKYKSDYSCEIKF